MDTYKPYRSYKTYAVVLFSAALFFAAAEIVSAQNVTTVVKPNGGECLTSGQSYTIEFSWSGADIEHIALYYRTDGQQPAHLDSSLIKHPINVPQQGTTWDWTPGSSHISETGRIWIDGHHLNHASLGTWDSSNADFAVRSSCASTAPPAAGGGGGNVFLTPPSIKNIAIKNITTSSAEISWQTDRPTYYRFSYGKISGKYTDEISTGPPYSDRSDHKLTLVNLEDGAAYYFRIKAGLYQPEPAESAEFSFRTLDKTPPGEVVSAFGVAGASTTLISWLNPPAPDFKETIIVRRDDRFPEHAKDGNIVFVGREIYYFDGELINGVKYYYSIFTADFNENTSGPVNIAVTPKETMPPAPFRQPTSEPATSTALRVASLFSEPQENGISLRWSNPEDADFLGVQIVRNDVSLPAHAYDGDVIFRGRTESFEDTGLLPEKRYNYGIFAFDWDNNFGSTSFISDIPLHPKEVIEKLKEQIEEAKGLVEKLIAAFRIRFPGAQIKPLEKPPAAPVPAAVYQVIVTADSFVPRSISVPQGAIVTWVNRSGGPAWVASDVHPTHEIYPGSSINKCGTAEESQIFDACRDIPLGGSYSFAFKKAGRWEYHDHLQPDVRNGEIIVK